MLESEYNGWLVRQLRKRLPHHIIWKHCDNYTSGIPDISVNLGRKTVWIESKVYREGKVHELTALQSRNVEKLNGLIVIFNDETKEMAIGKTIPWQDQQAALKLLVEEILHD